MIKRVLGILIVLISQVEGGCQSRDYKKEFEYTMHLIKENGSISDEILNSLIPKNEFEFKSYYTFYSDPKWKSEWDEIDKKIGKRVYQREEPLFTDFMNLSAFVHRDSVDEEFLTDFYYDIDFVIESNNEYFCKIYPTLKSEAKNNLSDWMKSYCE